MGRTILFATLAPGSLALVGGTAFAAVVRGALGADDLAGGNAPDTVLGGPGKDSLDGRGADDLLRGEEGDDTLIDLAGDDVLRGGLGDDTFGGNPGGDEVFGGPGNDILLDSAGDDEFSGGAGHDAIAVPGFGPGPPGLPLEPDAISCGPGRDRAVAHKVDRVAGDCEEVDRLGSGN
jgi:hypothetical protein